CRPAGGAEPARALRRGAHRGHQAAEHHRTATGLLRREGLPAADPDPAAGARPGPGRPDRRGADRPRPGRAGAVQPQCVPVRRRAGQRAGAQPGLAGRPGGLRGRRPGAGRGPGGVGRGARTDRGLPRVAGPPARSGPALRSGPAAGGGHGRQDPAERQPGCRADRVNLPQRLLAPAPGWITETDVVVVGSGIAGLTTALRIAAGSPGEPRPRVLVVTKDVLAAGSTRWAQGGIAAALGPHDTPAEHLHDTLVAGVGLCDPAAVQVLVDECPTAVAELIELGTRFDRTGTGALSLTREGGHHRDRIAH